MLDQVVVKTKNKASLKPLLVSAIQNEIWAISFGLDRTRQRLSEFEGRFGMSSADFERGLNSGKLEESFDFTDWRMEIGMFRLLEDQLFALREAQVG